MPILTSIDIADKIIKRKPKKAIVITTGKAKSGKSLYLCNIMNSMEEKFNIETNVSFSEWHSILEKGNIVMYESQDVGQLQFIKYMAKKHKYDLYHVAMIANYEGFVTAEFDA